MTHQPSLANPRLWADRRAHYLTVFERALMLLREKAELPEDEPNLTRELSFTVVAARLEIDPDGRFERPRFEAQSLADPDYEGIPPHEHKRPDIQWVHDDDAAADDRHREKSFVLECKRLGRTTASGWKLNEQYAVNGVARFRCEECRYGNHMAEGAMIAFVQNMDFDAIQAEVNQHLRTAGIPLLERDDQGVKERAVSHLDHQFRRSFPISPFHLRHLWLDIRDIKTKQRITPKKSPPKPSPRAAK